ncbi:zinc finger MYND domain-containing protein [archaeon]|nr:MAG: zinc finger MYND domain-containing protein [archaeon]
MLNDATNSYGSNIPRCPVCQRMLCDDGTALLKCSAFKDEFYCSKERQTQHWEVHKKMCSIKRRMAV